MCRVGWSTWCGLGCIIYLVRMQDLARVCYGLLKLALLTASV